MSSSMSFLETFTTGNSHQKETHICSNVACLCLVWFEHLLVVMTSPQGSVVTFHITFINKAPVSKCFYIVDF